MLLKVKVKPNAKKEGVFPLGDNLYEVRVSAPPEKGKANERLLELLAKHLKIPKSRLRIIKGHTTKNKLVEVDGSS